MLKKLILSFLLILSLGIVFGVGFHTASEITQGIFSGNFTFSDNLNVNNLCDETGNNCKDVSNGWSDSAGTNLVPKAYVRFDGTDGSIINSYNIASVTRTGIGQYTIYFENNLNNSNYLIVGSASNPGSESYNRIISPVEGTLNESEFKIYVKHGSPGFSDQPSVNIIVY